jgi:hypothetical protein
MTKKEASPDEALYTLEFLFNSGKTEPSTIVNLPRSQVYRFGSDELMGWLDLTEEDSIQVVDKLLRQIDSGKRKFKTTFPNGETFRIISQSKV